jgi:hypothetical protein
MDNVIYSQFRGKMTRLNKPRLPNNANFLITFKGMDWSGFRTLAECEAQFPELEKREGDHFEVVER